MARDIDDSLRAQRRTSHRDGAGAIGLGLALVCLGEDAPCVVYLLGVTDQLPYDRPPL